MKGTAAANAAATAATATNLAPGNLSLLKRLHLQFLCGVILDIDTPAIWMEVRAALTKYAALIVLIHHLMVGMDGILLASLLWACGSFLLHHQREQCTHTGSILALHL